MGVTCAVPNPTIGVRGPQHQTEDMTVEDDKIIDLFWMRDQTAIQETSTKYGRKLQRLAVKILYSHEDGLDYQCGRAFCIRSIHYHRFIGGGCADYNGNYDVEKAA